MNKLTTIGIVILLVIIAVFGYIVINDIQFDNNKSQNTNNKSHFLQFMVKFVDL